MRIIATGEGIRVWVVLVGGKPTRRVGTMISRYDGKRMGLGGVTGSLRTKGGASAFVDML